MADNLYDAIRQAEEARDEVHRELRRERTALVFKTTSNILLAIGGMLAVAALASTGFLSDGRVIRNPYAAPKATVTRSMLNEEKERIDRLAGEVAGLRKAIQAPAKDVQISVLEERLSAVEQAQKRISETITASPEKALELPMMRRDLVELKAANIDGITSVRREIDRVYDMVKAVVFTLAASVITIVLGAALKLWISRPKTPAAEA